MSRLIIIVSIVVLGILLWQWGLPALYSDAQAKSRIHNKDTKTPMFTNRLKDATSPYLLQHKHNPVDWYEWGEEALNKAKKENKPIFLSIGYSACHWCHVMAHESFEDEEVAKILNEHFINVKVDREERPDLDDIYMTSVQMMTGSGGWPMSVFLTPELKPFYGGTYFPKTDKYGRVGFITLTQRLAEAWRDRRDEVLTSAEKITQAIDDHGDSPDATGKITFTHVESAARSLLEQFDPRDGGFGDAPKFPNSNAIGLLLREFNRTGNKSMLHAAEYTLMAMANGGMYDHLGGGFHRYSVDDKWLVPHFEKMLYDNGQLAVAYLSAYQLTAKGQYADVVRDMFDYQLTKMTGEKGGFYSTEDADSEGKEGEFYVWEYDEIKALLAKDAFDIYAAYYNIRPDGNFSSHESYHKGKNIPHITRPLSEVAKSLKLDDAAANTLLKQARETLFIHRDKRIHPGLDDKILTSWNALMITAMAKGYQVLGDESYLSAAQRAANFILSDMRYPNGELYRSHRQGKSSLHGYLDDYAFLIAALIDLYEADFDSRWLKEANALAKIMIRDFWDAKEGGFFFSRENNNLITRMKPYYDSAEPSGNAVAIEALMRLSLLLGENDYKDKALHVLAQHATHIERAPTGLLRLINTAHDYVLSKPKEIAVVARSAGEAADLLQVVQRNFLPNKVLALGSPDDKAPFIPWLKQRPTIEGLPTAYVCENYTCQQPVNTVKALKAQLGFPDWSELTGPGDLGTTP